MRSELAEAVQDDLGQQSGGGGRSWIQGLDELSFLKSDVSHGLADWWED